MGRLDRLMGQFREKSDREGIVAAVHRSAVVAHERTLSRRAARRNADAMQFFDVIFINGCDYSVPHPIRYRIAHQIQQLESAGMAALCVEMNDLTDDVARMARTFIIFRCPYSERIGSFIRLAKSLNKRVYFDIDDLVIDTRYTDDIPYLATMPKDARAGYDEGVRSMGKTLVACGAAITTTTALARELARYVPEVFVNRNVASEEMLRYGERAIYERDVLPLLDMGEVPVGSRHYWRWASECHEERVSSGAVTIGYFSGSITHNDDFALVAAPLADVLRMRPQARLLVVGLLDIPSEFEEFGDRVRRVDFCEWQQLERLMAGIDINIAPLADTLFNEAKSENKWVEAALVKVVTVASRVGAFAEMMSDAETGLLCSDGSEWRETLLRLIDDPLERRRLGEAAHDWVVEHATTIATSHHLATYLRSRQTSNIFVMLPSLKLSGGVLVALRHARILLDAGYDVSIINDHLVDDAAWVDVKGRTLPVVHLRSGRNKEVRYLFRGHVDHLVATMWTTLAPALEYPNVGRVSYLVQGLETGFYEPGDPQRIHANLTYERDDVDYLTVSRWCQGWLRQRYGKEARHCPNGLDTASFPSVPRNWEGRVRVLIEGDSDWAYKNVDEAFRIVDLLDRERYEVWYLSYGGSPKDSYRYDRFLHAIPHEEVHEVYQQCHILLKTSWLESFSYPPLEMMSTGGAVVALPNEGNQEYLRDGENCLTYERGDLTGAAAAIRRIAEDEALREHLRLGGLATAASRDWDTIIPQVIDLYT